MAIIEPTKPFKKPDKPVKKETVISEEIRKLKASLASSGSVKVEEEVIEEQYGDPDIDSMIQNSIQLHFLKQLVDDLTEILDLAPIKEDVRALIQENIKRIKLDLNSGAMGIKRIEEETVYLHNTMQKLGKMILEYSTEKHVVKTIKKYEGKIPFMIMSSNEEENGEKKKKDAEVPFLLQKSEGPQEEEPEE